MLSVPSGCLVCPQHPPGSKHHNIPSICRAPGSFFVRAPTPRYDSFVTSGGKKESRAHNSKKFHTTTQPSCSAGCQNGCGHLFAEYFLVVLQRHQKDINHFLRFFWGGGGVPASMEECINCQVWVLAGLTKTSGGWNPNSKGTSLDQVRSESNLQFVVGAKQSHPGFLLEKPRFHFHNGIYPSSVLRSFPP